MRKKGILFLAFMVVFSLCIAGCEKQPDAKPISRFYFHDEPVESVRIINNLSHSEDRSYQLNDEEVEEYLKLLKTLPEEADMEYDMLTGIMPLTVAIKRILYL